MSAAESAEQRRAAVIAGIRALADLLENNPDLPTPDSVHAQHSLRGGLDDAGRDVIRRVGEKFNLPNLDDGYAESYVRFDNDSAAAHYLVAAAGGPGYYRVVYAVHGAIRKAGEQA